MKRLLKYQFLWQKKAKIRFGIPLIGTTLVMISMVVVILSNTYQLEQRLEHYAETYSADVSEQLASRIALQLNQKASDMRSLAETFSKMPDEVLTENLMKQKEKSLDVTQLFILNEDGTTFPEIKPLEGFQKYLDTEKGIEEMTHVSFLEQNKVIFSTPFSKNGALHLLISVCTGDALQEMLEDFNYDSEGRCCLIDQSGSLIIAPSDMQPFYDLEQVFHDKKTSEANKDAVASITKDIEQGKSGLTVFRDIDNHNIIVNYDFLGVCDWMLLSVLPQDLLSEEVRGYSARFIMVALALIFVTLGIVILIITIYLKNMQHIKDAALTDPLTRGDNSTAFRMRGEYRLKEFPEQGRSIVYLNNLDFRSYNSRFGVKGADEILHSVYQTIKKHLHEQELVSRCDGTSFCMLLECNDKAVINERLKAISDAIRQLLHNTYSVDNHQLALGAYIIPEKPYDFIHMLDWAKLASTYHTSSESYKIFDDSIVKILRRENKLDGDFEHAIENHEFKLYIQPKISPADNRLLGGEILVRWEHPEYGLVPPNDFIPLFEKNGKICTLDFYMFEETCKLLKGWIEKGTAIPLSVNLSRAHLGSHNFEFLESFYKIKEQYQIPDNMIELELTESIILERQEVSFVLEVMNRIQSMGFSCSLDDFGFGYSCLTLLKDLNINTVKLDRQFFLNENEKSWVVIEELIRMAHQLQIAVVAEGIEEWEQVQKLKVFHCDLIQGYVYSKPLSIPAFDEWKNQNSY